MGTLSATYVLLLCFIPELKMTRSKSYVHKPATRPLDCRTLAQLHDYHTGLHPQAEAFVIYDFDANRSVHTFRDVKDKSVKIAALLLDMGIRAGQRVALKAPNQIEFVWCLLALNRIGANAILLDMHGNTEEEVANLVQRLKCQVFLFYPTGNGPYDNNLLQKVGDILSEARIINISQENHNPSLTKSVKNLWDLLAMTSPLNESEVYKQQDKVQIDDHALVIFSSGSTGPPKAITYTHHAVVNEAFAAGTYLLGLPKDGEGRRIDSRLFNDRPFTYAACLIATMINVFANGCTLVSIPPPMAAKRMQTEFVLTVLQNEKCTEGIFAPYLIHDLISFPGIKEFHLEHLRWFFSSGQSIPLHHYTQLQTLLPNCVLLYTYAMSELGSIATRKFDISNQDYLESLDIVPSVEVKIVSEDKEIVPIGERGEICVRSPLSFCGLLESSKEEIRNVLPSGWIHTDDAGYIDEHGRLHVLGRMHEVISKAIKKFYPFAIEKVLSAYPDVKAVVVMGVPDKRLYEEVCACVIPKAGTGLEKGLTDFVQWASSQFMADELELTKKPKYILLFQEFPLTKTGKTNRKALKEIALERLGLR